MNPWNPVVGCLPLILVILSFLGCRPPAAPGGFPVTEIRPGLGYTNLRDASVPWSIHVVRIDRTDPALSLMSIHADPGAVGLAPLTEQIRRLPAGRGLPVAAVNGDFYQRDRAYAGDPRGLQIVDGELRSGPSGGVAFFLDRTGQPRATNVTSRFEIQWPDGTQRPFLLNAERPADGLSLFTPAVGPRTHSVGGREWVLEPENAALSGLVPDDDITVRVTSVREDGNSPLRPGTWVLSAGPVSAKKLPPLAVGDRVRISTSMVPSLRGSTLALGGGPVLVRLGIAQKIRPGSKDTYEFSSMLERHPRSAIGWDDHFFYLVTVDGRQPTLSLGMTLDELGQFLARIGCREAMNLDGGGSATLWCDGKIRNSPCDGQERAVANGLVVLSQGVERAPTNGAR